MVEKTGPDQFADNSLYGDRQWGRCRPAVKCSNKKKKYILREGVYI